MTLRTELLPVRFAPKFRKPEIPRHAGRRHVDVTCNRGLAGLARVSTISIGVEICTGGQVHVPQTVMPNTSSNRGNSSRFVSVVTTSIVAIQDCGVHFVPS